MKLTCPDRTRRGESSRILYRGFRGSRASCHAACSDPADILARARERRLAHDERIAAQVVSIKMGLFVACLHDARCRTVIVVERADERYLELVVVFLGVPRLGILSWGVAHPH